LTENVNLFPDAVENPPSWMCPFITGLGDSDLTIRRKQLNNIMLDSKLNCGFATASGKGMTCSISSHLKAQDLLSDAERQIVSSGDNNVSVRLNDKEEPVINGHIQDGVLLIVKSESPFTFVSTSMMND
jgi:hypothetical protein